MRWWVLVILVLILVGLVVNPGFGGRVEPFTGAVLSLTIPGSGEFYAGDSKKGAIFLGLGIGVYFSGKGKGWRNTGLMVVRALSMVTAIGCAKRHNYAVERLERERLEKGHVVEVIDEHRVIISIGRNAGVKEGTKFVVYDGERRVGMVVVVAVFESSSVAKVEEGEAVGKVKENNWLGRLE